MIRRTASSSRAALGWGLLFFVAAQLAVSAAMECGLPQLRERDFAWKWHLLRQRVASEPARPLVLMLGGTRTLADFEAARLDGMPGPDGRPLTAFNFGLRDSGPLRAWIFCQSLFDAGIRPRLLLVEVSPPFLNEAGHGRACEEEYMGTAWPSFTDLVRLWPYCRRPLRLTGEWLWSRLVPCSVQREQVMEYLAQDWEPETWRLPPLARIDRSGWDADASHWRSKEEELLCRRWPGRGQSIGNVSSFRLGVGPTRALNDLLERARRENVPVALVLMPEGRGWGSWDLPEIERAVCDFVRNLRRTWGVEVLDARRWVPHENSWNSEREPPSAVFTSRLVEEVLRVLAKTAAQ